MVSPRYGESAVKNDLSTPPRLGLRAAQREERHRLTAPGGLEEQRGQGRHGAGDWRRAGMGLRH